MDEKNVGKKPPHAPGSIEKAWDQHADEGGPVTDLAQQAAERRAAEKQQRESQAKSVSSDRK